MLSNFLLNCRVSPDASCKLATLIKQFRATLPPGEAAHWPRSRILAEVARRYPVGLRCGVLYVGGISLLDQAAWQVAENGNLVLA